MDSLANSFSSSRAAAATCNEVITIATQIMAVVAENPANPTVSMIKPAFLLNTNIRAGDHLGREDHLNLKYSRVHRC